MFKALLTRVKQGHRTAKFPRVPPTLPDRYRGVPAIDRSKCTESCGACAKACPTAAITMDGAAPVVDLGACLMCNDCAAACEPKAISWSPEYRVAVRKREELVLRGAWEEKAAEMGAELRRLFGRSFKLRQVSAGGCNACEADVNVLGTVVFDLGRFGVQVVASPRHADGILVTGPVTENMREALLKTYAAVPAPKVVIAVGSCAISGGPMRGFYEVVGGVDKLLPVDLYIPGCPPSPYAILDGLLRFLGRGGQKPSAPVTVLPVPKVDEKAEGEMPQARSAVAR